jgi:hypothetical protein
MTDFEHTLPGLYNEDPDRRKASQQLLTLRGLTPIEALVVDEAFAEASKALLGLVGRTVDGVTPSNGLQLLTLKHVCRGIVFAAGQLNEVIGRMTDIELVADGIAFCTPGCDCGVCKIAHQINESLQKALE